MNRTGVVIALALASFSSLASVAHAQTTTGANSSITLPTPPRSMSSMPVPTTPGVDSTFQGNVQPNLQSNYTLTVPWTYSGSGVAAASAGGATAATALSRPLPRPRSTTPPTGH